MVFFHSTFVVVTLNFLYEFVKYNIQIKYKDNMNLDNLINFSKQNDK